MINNIRWEVAASIFFLGAISWIKVRLIGEFSVAEIVILFCVPITLIGTFTRLMEARKLTIFYLFIGYLLAQIAADLYRENPPIDYFRGWAKLVVFFASFIVCYRLAKWNTGYLLIYLFGQAIGVGLSFLVEGNKFGEGHWYKFYVGGPLTLFVMYFVCAFWQRPNIFSTLVGIGVGAISLVMNSRSLAALTWLAVALNVLRFSVFSNSTRVWSKTRILFSLGLFAATGLLIFEMYKLTASAGILGERALEKYEMQSSLNATGNFNIFSGRNEIYFAIPKIVDSPIIGYGSWPKDLAYVHSRASELGLNAAGLIAAQGEKDTGMIPTHSHFLGGWLEAGIMGAIFWLYVLYIIIGLMYARWRDGIVEGSYLYNYLLISFAWQVLFSFFGGDNKVLSGVMIALVVVLLERHVVIREIQGRMGRSNLLRKFSSHKAIS